MLRFILAHLLQDRPGLLVVGWNLLQVFVEMADHLILGGGDEAQADPVADQTGDRADSERQTVKQRVEHAGLAAELADTLLAPGQVIDFLVGGMFHGRAHLRQLGGQCLALIKRLGANLASVVDAHQTGDMLGLLFIEFRFWLHHRR